MRVSRSQLCLTAMLAVTSCDATGPPRGGDSARFAPTEVADFRVLYSQNCSGCHGANGQGALTVGIGRPVYLAIADDATIRRHDRAGQAWNPDAGFRAESGRSC